MEVKVASTAGFCFGVERAIKKVYEEIDKGLGPIYTLGPIIHNEEVVKDLASKGVKVIEAENIEKLQTGTVIIRSHGVPKSIYDQLDNKGINYVDATCPFVKKIHKIVAEESGKGNYILIIGDESHPEVEGDDISIVKTEEEAKSLIMPKNKKICIVAQTTFNFTKFKEIVEIVAKNEYNINVLNTICNATEERQKEAKEIASYVDVMIVIGGRSSSNTQKLFEICKEKCENTYYIQTVADLVGHRFGPVQNVGITAGASTPKNIIEEVQRNVRNEF